MEAARRLFCVLLWSSLRGPYRGFAPWGTHCMMAMPSGRFKTVPRSFMLSVSPSSRSSITPRQICTRTRHENAKMIREVSRRLEYCHRRIREFENAQMLSTVDLGGRRSGRVHPGAMSYLARRTVGNVELLQTSKKLREGDSSRKRRRSPAALLTCRRRCRRIR